MKLPQSLIKWLRTNPLIREDEEKFQGPCPIHPGADNPTAFVVYKDSGIWRCFTHQCHDEGQSARHLCKLLEIDPGNPEYNGYVDPYGTSSQRRKRVQTAICTREEFCNRICELPSKYALSRGFSEYTLRKYCIGTSYKKGSMAFRCVCPIFSDDYRHVVGMTGRDINGDKPMKWYHEGFNSAHNLYNLWFAKSTIRNTKTVVLVEGVFDVLALEQAGVKNALATFGVGLKPIQESILQKLGVQNVVFGYDDDEAARIATENTQKKYDLSYNFEILQPPKKDWAECSTSEIEEYIRVQDKKLIS